MAHDDIQDLLRTGIQAAQSGNKAAARRILQQVIDQEPANEVAWIWLATVAEDVEARRRHLQRVLEINPANERAQEALARLDEAQQQAKRPETPAPPPPADSAAANALADRIGTARRSTTPPPVSRQRRAPTARPRSQPAPASHTAPAASPRPVRRRSTLYYLVGLLAIGMIVGGLALLWFDLQAQSDDDTNATTTPVAGAPDIALAPTRTSTAIPVATSLPGLGSPTPLGGELRTVPPSTPLPPTWTPSPTASPPPSPTLAPTEIPLAEHTLVVAAKRDSASTWSLYTIRADGSGERRLTASLPDNESEQRLLNIYDPAFAPDGTQIAVTVHVEETRLDDETDESVVVEYEDLYLLPASGGTLRRLTDLEATSLSGVDWSPTGTRIAFAAEIDGNADIYVLDLDEDVAFPVAASPAQDRDPAWSPNGQTLAFASDRSSPGFLEIWRVNADQTGLRQLTDNVNSSYAPDWSPDGTRLVFLSNRRVNTDMYIVSSEGGIGNAILVRDVDAEERDPTWSPDGNWIAFSSNRDIALWTLYVIRPDGTDLQRLTADQGDTRYPAWQPVQP